MSGRPANAIERLRRGLDESLFLTSPRPPRKFGRGEGAVLLLALLALAVILQLLRAGPSYALGSIWAEDGPVFLDGAQSGGFVEMVFTPYADYLVLMPRLIGELGAQAPLREIPAVLAVASGAVVALSGLAVWFASANHIRNPYLRATLAVTAILAPVASLEAVTSGTFVGWYMLFATFWLLLWRPVTTVGAILAGLFVLATALTNPGVLYFAPLAALRALAARDRRDLLILGPYAAGAAIQAAVVATRNEVDVDPAWSSDILTSYLQRVLDGALLGERLGGDAWSSFGWPFLIGLLVCAAAGFGFAIWRSTAPGRYVAAIAIATSLVMFLGSAYQRAAGPVIVWSDGLSFGVGGRYAIVPALLLVSAALVLIDRSARPRRGPSALPWLGMAAVATILVATVTSFDVRNSVARGTPAWDDALERAAPKCATRPAGEVLVPISPPGFAVYVSCERIESTGLAVRAR